MNIVLSWLKTVQNEATFFNDVAFRMMEMNGIQVVSEVRE